MATFNKFQSYSEAIGEEIHNFDSDTFKVALTNTEPNVATDTQLSDITQISAGNGYTTGGNTVANTTYTRTGSVSVLDGDNVTFTASGGTMATFRYAVLYNDSAPNDELIGYFDYGLEVSLPDTEPFIVGWNASGIIANN
jgi:hypothetical protein